MPTAETSPFAIDPTLLQQLKGIELKSRFLVRGLYNNRHRTSDFGSSTEFIEHREYRRGDEIRSIDWRVFARTDRYYVKVHEMEANMRVFLVMDTSDSMRIPPLSGHPSKLELACTIAGAVATMAQGQQEAISLACLGDSVEEFIPPRQGQSHLLQIYEHLSEPRGHGGGRFGELVLETAPRLGTRAVVFLITDALDDPQVLFSALKNLRAREHDVNLVQILDRKEVEFPFDRMSEFRNPESGERIIGDPGALRSRYFERLNQFQEQLRLFCQKAQADYLRLHTGEDLGKLLTMHFIRRLLVLSKG